MMIGSRTQRRRTAPPALPPRDFSAEMSQPDPVRALASTELLSPSTAMQDGLDLARATSSPAVRPRNGILDRIGDFLSSDEGRAALLRSAAATFQGGLGAGLQAGAQFMDQRRAQGEDTRRFDLVQRLRETAEANTDARGWAGLGLQEAGLGETRRHNMASEGLTTRAQDIDWRLGRDRNSITREGNFLSADTTRRGQDVDERNNMRSTGVAERNSVRDYDASIYGSNMGYRAAVDRPIAAGIGSRTIRRTTPGTPAVNGWFSDTPATPEVVETIEMPVSAQQGGGQQSYPQPPPAAIQTLRDNPGLAGEFDRMYGPGASQQYLGGR